MLKNLHICDFCCTFGLRLLRIPPNLRSLSRANNKAFPLKIQINLIFIVKSLYIPNICSKFAPANQQSTNLINKPL